MAIPLKSMLNGNYLLWEKGALGAGGEFDHSWDKGLRRLSLLPG